jgi:hypothetical protein
LPKKEGAGDLVKKTIQALFLTSTDKFIGHKNFIRIVLEIYKNERKKENKSREGGSLCEGMAYFPRYLLFHITLLFIFQLLLKYLQQCNAF